MKKTDLSKTASRSAVKSRRQQRFVVEYLCDLNGTQAAIRAGYAPKTARISAAKLLTKGNIQELVKKGMEKRAEKATISADQVVAGLVRIVNAKAEGPIRYSDQLRAFELLARHLGMLVDKHEVSGPGGASVPFNDTERATKLQRLIQLAGKRRMEEVKSKEGTTLTSTLSVA